MYSPIVSAISNIVDFIVSASEFVGNEPAQGACQPDLTIVHDAQEKRYGLIVVGEKDVAVLDPQGEVDRVFRGEIAVENLNQAKPLDEVLEQRILQLTPFFSEEYECGMMQRITGCTSGR